jgi:hypothetical protein
MAGLLQALCCLFVVGCAWRFFCVAHAACRGFVHLFRTDGV